MVTSYRSLQSISEIQNLKGVLIIENIIMALSPDRIVIGGKISKYHKIYKDHLVEYLNRESELFSIEESIITYSKLKGRASILGAGLMPIHQLLSTGATTL